MSDMCIAKPASRLSRIPPLLIPSNLLRLDSIKDNCYLDALGVKHDGFVGFCISAEIIYNIMRSQPKEKIAFHTLEIGLNAVPVKDTIKAVKEYFNDLNCTTTTPLWPLKRVYKRLTRDNSNMYTAAFHIFHAVYPDAEITLPPIPDNIFIRSGIECGVMLYMLEKYHDIVIPCVN